MIGAHIEAPIVLINNSWSKSPFVRRCSYFIDWGNLVQGAVAKIWVPSLVQDVFSQEVYTLED